MSAPPLPSLETFLRRSAWAATLAAEDLDSVVRHSHERRLATGGHAMRCGDPADCWVGVIDGLVKMSVSQADGRVSTFTGVTAGGWAGEGSLLKAGCWRYDGVALRPTRLACVPRRCFERLVATSLPFNHYLLQQVNARLSLFISLVEFDRLLGPDARVARCLASLFDPALYPTHEQMLLGHFAHPPRGADDGRRRPGGTQDTGATRTVQLSQDEIGLLAAVSRQRAHQALHQLEREGLLRIEFGGVTVLDLPGLRRYDDAAPAPTPRRPSMAPG